MAAYKALLLRQAALPEKENVLDCQPGLLGIERLLPHAEHSQGGHVQNLLDCARVSPSLEHSKRDALVEFDRGGWLLVRQYLVLVKGEVALLHLFAELVLDPEVLLVGDKGVAVVGGRTAAGLPPLQWL